MPARSSKFRLPTDCWALLYEWLEQVCALDRGGPLARLRASMPPGGLAALDGCDLLAGSRAFLRDDAQDEVLRGVWEWALDHRLVRPLDWLRERDPWDNVETYFHYNYSRSLLCMAAEILRLPAGPFPDWRQIADSRLRLDPREIHEYLALARAARHITPEDLALIEAAIRRPLPGKLDARSIDALTLAGAPAVGKEHSFQALALYQVGQLSAEGVRSALFPPATEEFSAPVRVPDRQVIERRIGGAAVLLVGRVHATLWMRDAITAGVKPKPTSRRSAADLG